MMIRKLPSDRRYWTLESNHFGCQIPHRPHFEAALPFPAAHSIDLGLTLFHVHLLDRYDEEHARCQRLRHILSLPHTQLLNADSLTDKQIDSMTPVSRRQTSGPVGMHTFSQAQTPMRGPSLERLSHGSTLAAAARSLQHTPPNG